MAKQRCVYCGKEQTGFFGEPVVFTEIKGDTYCSECAEKYLGEMLSPIQLTTTHNLDGYRVKRYIDIGSVEIVIGTGPFSEFTGGIADLFGERSTAFERKLKRGKEIALRKLKYEAFMKDGNAVIGVDLDYTEFSRNRIGLIANGTIVEIEPVEVANG